MDREYENKCINKAIKDGLRVTVFTSNGYQMKGRIKYQDTNVIVLEIKDDYTTMVYKNAISTIEFSSMSVNNI